VGPQFHWRQFRLEQLAGRVDWVGQTLGLTNLIGVFKMGRVTGDAFFDFGVAHDAEFSFKTALTGVDLRELIPASDAAKTNKLEGLLSGEFAIISANSSDPKSWQGQGHLTLRDGLIW